MQKTTFPVQVLIHDDASTDRTADIIREYEAKNPGLIRAYYQKENSYSKIDPKEKIKMRGVFNSWRIGKYEALCEGDDYWTDPLKLQKQVNFLEMNPEYGLVHTELDHYYFKTGKYVKNHWEISGVDNQSGDIYNSLLEGRRSMIYYCTACFRSDLVKDIDSEKFARYVYVDSALWLHIASKSKIGYINESTAVRNVLLYSATQGRDFDYRLKRILESFSIFDDFNKIRPFSKQAGYNFFQHYSLHICEICYQFRRRFDLFEENFLKLDSNYKSKALKQKRILFKYRFPVLISRIFLKAASYIWKER
jgi:glycosyltransferase involved in cell wall biosynthesis